MFTKKSLERLVIKSDLNFLVGEVFAEFKINTFKNQTDLNEFRSDDRKIKGVRIRVTVEKIS